MPIDKYSHQTTELPAPAGYTDKQLTDTVSVCMSWTEVAILHLKYLQFAFLFYRMLMKLITI